MKWIKQINAFIFEKKINSHFQNICVYLTKREKGRNTKKTYMWVIVEEKNVFISLTF